MFLRTFGWSFAVSIAALIAAFLYGTRTGGLAGGWTALTLCLILAVLEISLSFDNAVVNAKVLERMSPAWQRIFLTIGIIIAVFGMRLLFPLLIVAVTANLGPIEALNLAMEGGDPEVAGSYGYILGEAHPQIAAFGGMFLFMLFVDFITEERELTWLTWLERPLAKLGALRYVSVIISATCLIAAAQFLAEEPHTVLLAGMLGLVTYLLVNGLGSLFESSHEEHEAAIAAESAKTKGSNGSSKVSTAAKATGKAGFFLFLYLEILDASFSFDGVIGAFAITPDPIIIALGLGLIGAMFVRSITVFMVRKGTLAEYVYLDHGAHWAIGALATILLISIKFEIPEIITGMVGIVFIGASFISSLYYRKHHRETQEASGADALTSETTQENQPL